MKVVAVSLSLSLSHTHHRQVRNVSHKIRLQRTGRHRSRFDFLTIVYNFAADWPVHSLEPSPTGRTLYLNTCEKLSQPPSQRIIDKLGTSEVNLNYRHMGVPGVRVLAKGLMVG